MQGVIHSKLSQNVNLFKVLFFIHSVCNNTTVKCGRNNLENTKIPQILLISFKLRTFDDRNLFTNELNKRSANINKTEYDVRLFFDTWTSEGVPAFLEADLKECRLKFLAVFVIKYMHDDESFLRSYNVCRSSDHTHLS